MFEAAKWAPSSMNAQPWRILYAKHGSEHWPHFFDGLMPGNQAWAKNAAVLVLFLSKKTLDHNGAPSPTHSFDAGAAWQNFALQGWLKGYAVHGMRGFDADLVRRSLDVPDGFHLEAMAAVGHPAPKETLAEQYQLRETPSARRSVHDTAREGPFTFPI
jgi:nitroreductase